MNIKDIIKVLLELNLLLIVDFWDLKMHSSLCCALDYFFGWHDDDLFRVETCCREHNFVNKLLCLTETCILYEY